MTYPSRSVRALRRALLAVLALAALLPASAHATTLMVEHLGSPGTAVSESAYRAAGHMGARYAREIVERGSTPWGAPFDLAAVAQFAQRAADNEMHPYLTLSGEGTPTPEQYGQWCGETALHFNGQGGRPLVLDYGVWNEPNHSPAIAASLYRELYVRCRAAIKAVLPSANVYFGELEAGGHGVCTYLANALRPTAGAPGAITTEGVAIHPYQYQTPPTSPMGDDPCRGIGNLPTWNARLAGTHAGQIAKPGGGPPPVLISEFGYCVLRPDAHPDAPYNRYSGMAACPQNLGGTANTLDEGTRANWVQSAFNWASQHGVTLFDYHGLVQREAGNFKGNERCIGDDGSPNPACASLPPDRRGGGFLWHSGIVANPSGDWTPTVGALRAATGTQSPAAVSSPASDVGTRRATLSGSVTPNGFKTTYRFEYGTDTSYGSSVPVPEGQIAAGAGATAVSHAINGLLSGTTYHYRLVATSRAGRTASEDRTFTTEPAPRPAAVTDADGDLHVFFRGSNGQLLEWRRVDEAWRHRTWGDPGAMAGDPAAVIRRSGRIEVFYRATDGHMHRRWIDGASSGVEQHELVNRIRGDPSAVVAPSGRVEVFYRIDGGYLRRIWFVDGGSGHNLNEEPGAVVGDPAVTVTRSGRLEVFYRYRDGTMRRHYFDSTDFRVWGVGNYDVALGDPAVAVSASGRLEAFYKFTSNQLRRLWFLTYPNEGYSDWAPWTVVGDPVAITTPGGSTEAFYRSNEGSLVRIWFADPSHWNITGPQTYGQVGGDPGAVVTPDGVPHVFFGDRWGNYYHYRFGPAGEQLEMIQEAPRATTGDATAVREKWATLRGTANASGWEATYWFEYGEDGRFGRRTDPVTLAAGDRDVAVERFVTGLVADTTYQYRLVASGPGGTARGETRTFKTEQMSRPAAVTNADGDLHFFFRGVNGQLLEYHHDGDGWSHRQWGQPGAMAGDPAAVMTRSGRIEVFYRATDGHLHRYWIDGARSGLEQHELVNAMRGDPTAVVAPSGRVEVFYRMDNGQLRRLWFDGGVGFTLNENAGSVVGDPAASITAAGRIEVFYRFRDGTMRRHYFDSVNLADWGVANYGPALGDPATAVSASGRIEAFYKFTSNQLRRLWFLAYPNEGFSDWAPWTVVGDPAAVTMPAGGTETYYRSNDGQMIRFRFSDPTGWNVTNPQTYGQVGGDVGAVVTPDGARHVFFGGRWGNYYHYRFTDLGEQLEMVQSAPTATTGGAREVREKWATLSGTVNPSSADTRYHFEYGEDRSYGRSTEPVALAAGERDVAVERFVTGLLADTTYHYRLVATGAGGVSRGEDRTFRTEPMSRPAAVAEADGDLHLFFRGVQGQLLEYRREDGGAWRQRVWGEPAAMAGDPAAVIRDDGRIEVFYRGTNGHLHRFWIDGERSGLEDDHEYVDRMRGDPTAVVTPSGRVEVYYRIVNGQLRRIWFDRGVGFTLNEEPNAVVGDPAAAVRSSGRIEVFYRYRGGVMRRHYFDAVDLRSWGVADYDAALGDPAATVTSTGRLEAFYRVGSDALRRIWFLAYPQEGFADHGAGTVVGAPAAVPAAGGRSEAYFRGRDGTLIRYLFDGSAWATTSPQTYGQVGGDAGAVVAPDGTRHVFFGGRWGNYYHLAVTDRDEQLAVIQ